MSWSKYHLLPTKFPTAGQKSSRSQMFVKIDVLKIFTNCTGKHLCRSLFLIKLKACNFIKKRLQYRCFPKKFAKFLRTPFFTEHLWWLLLSALKKYIFSRTVNIKKDSTISLLKKQEIMTI